MLRVRILIIEDEYDQGQDLKKMLEEKGYEVTGIATSLQDGLGMFYAQKPDIAIIDVYLNGKPDGIVFAERINENLSTVRPFLFLTSSIDDKTFNSAKLTAPYSYLLKPFNILELQFSIELAMRKFSDHYSVSDIEGKQAEYENFFWVKKKDILFKVDFEAIELIEVEGRYVTIVTPGGSFLVEIALKLILQRLPEKQFIQIHRNYIVNVKKVAKLYLSDHCIQLNSGRSLAISRRFKEHFISKYTILK